MTTKTLSERLCGWFLAASVLLGGCAPGSGGTGTGPTHSYSGFGATVVFAQTTGNSTSSGGPVVDVGATGCVAASARVDLKLYDNRIEVVTPCSTFSFDGEWPQGTSGSLLVGGIHQTPALGQVEMATLQLVFSDTTSAVTVTVVDTQGRVLVGPVTLQPVP
ncbi:MAG: hypothetical protein HY854_12380 [Burkholderiales bacterium]|nr:hypothetical protein [Burkholderiales bacterium]